MRISGSDWDRYIRALKEVNRQAADAMQGWMDSNPGATADELIRTAYLLSGRYGEAAASLACEMYDATADAQGAAVPPAEPAAPATYSETAKAVQGTMKNRQNTVPQTVGRLVKQTGADTMLKNAGRDGAEWAWVPRGDTCAFCITLASRGWQKTSKAALKGGHAEHIHANCDCEYAVRFDGKSGVAGYDPEKYLKMYENAEGGSSQEKINSMRRELEAGKRDEINARKREAYAEKKGLKPEGKTGNINLTEYITAAKQAGDTVQPESVRRNYEDFDTLDISEEVRAELRELNRLAKETDEEYGFSQYPGGKTENHTDHDHNGVRIPLPKEGEHIELYHCHTDDSVLSTEDFKSVLNEKIDRDCVISRNGDVWIVDYSNGIRPAGHELAEAFGVCYEEAKRTVAENQEYENWAFEERYYMLGREQMFRLGRLFEWKIMGGHIDEQ